MAACPAFRARWNRPAVLAFALAAAAAAAALFAPPLLPAAAGATRRASAEEPATAAAAEDMLGRLNAARTANGLRPYRSSPLLAAVAAAHAREVAENNHYSHTGLDGRSARQRMADAGYGAGHSGVRTSENFVARSTVEEGFQWLMDDPGHRPNMLDAQFREVGVGAAPTRFGFVWVLDFGMYDGVDDLAAPTVPATVPPTLPPTLPAATVTVAAAATEVVTATTAVTATALPTSTADITAGMPSRTTMAVSDTVARTTTAAPTSANGVTPPTRSPLPTAEPATPTGGISAAGVGMGVFALLVVVGLLAWASTRPGFARRR